MSEVLDLAAVMARLLRAGEEVTATNPVYNPNHKQPSL